MKRLNGIVVDVETGGLDPARCALLEVGLVAVHEGRAVMDYGFRVAAAPMLAVDPEAAVVNGYDPARWGGTTEAHAAAVVHDFCQATQRRLGRQQLTWIGANTPFDRAFLDALMRRTRHPPLAYFTHRDVDVSRIAVVGMLAGKLRGVGVDSLRKSLLGRADRPLPHTALGDCRETLDILRALLARLRWADPPEEEEP